MHNENPQSPQVDVITVRPDCASKKFLKSKLRDKEILANKSRFYRKILALGIAALRADSKSNKEA